MSNTDPDFEFIADWDDVTAKFSSLQGKNENIMFRPSEAVLDKWSLVSAETKAEAAQQMKLFSFWLPILLRRDESSTTACWALLIGLIDSNEDLSLKNIHRIEIVEAIFRALEKGTLNKNQSKRAVWLTGLLNTCCPDSVEVTLQWLERTGEPGIRHRVRQLGHTHMCFLALRFIFTEFINYMLAMGTDLMKMMNSLCVPSSPFHVDLSEEMKKKGNENFQRKQYEDALNFYTKALALYPENHIVYGNRALCFMRCNMYLNAVGDGKCAVLIKPLWAKGHYRYCEALFLLGEVKLAIEANRSAQDLCKNEQEGIKDLEQQHLKFLSEISDLPVERPKKTHSKRSESSNRTHVVEPQPKSVGEENHIDPPVGTAPQRKFLQKKMDKKPGKAKCSSQVDDSSKDCKPSTSDVSSKNGKGQSVATPKKKPEGKSNSGSEVRQNQQVDSSKAAVLRSVVQDACAALVGLRSRNAEQAFSQALALLDTSTPKELGLCTLDVMLLLYGCVTALTEIGMPEELGAARRLLDKIQAYEERTFQCLVFYALGRIYVKENRFTMALEQFSNSLQMVKYQIVPCKHTWPLTKEVVKETQSDYLKEILENAIELCTFPPIPDAICRFDKCHGHLKAEIYFTDPDFKGFIQIRCCQNCFVEYHATCWKTLKATSKFEINEKDYVQKPCFTPDCIGEICSIKIFGSTGMVKCKFEVAILKEEIPKKPKVKQKCTSLKNVKSKEEHRLKRKQRKQAFQEAQKLNNESLEQKEDSAPQVHQRAWLLYRDRVLLQINQNMELLREEKGLHVSALTSSLKPWLELDSLKGNQLAVKILHWEMEQLDSVGQVVEVLLQRKNRVWARVLIQFLSSCLNLNPKLYNWACQLNSAGLNAATCFVERHSGHLEQLDLSGLMDFSPLQESVVEKLGTRPELFSSIGLTVTEYLKQAPPQDMRLFIWALEEHRDNYDSCHFILDEYFDIMDGNCSVLKKSDEPQNNSPMKRTRKKKLKKAVNVWSGPTDEWDQNILEDDSLSFLHPGDPFSVPSHLQEQVAEFEEQYNSRHGFHSNVFLDSSSDQIKESLYEYFAQILEECGPLVADDPVLVGELKYFPPMAQQKISESGGFEPFLLKSLRFVKIGRSIGLAKHAVPLQEAECGSRPDQGEVLDVLENNNAYSAVPDSYTPPSTSNPYDYSPPNNEVFPVVPYLYAYGPLPPPPCVQPAMGVTWHVPFPHLASGYHPQQAAGYLYDSYEKRSIYFSDADDGVSENDPSVCGVASVTSEDSAAKRHAAAQTCWENMRSVSVNTEPVEPFESCLGDINKKLQSIKELEKQIQDMPDDSVSSRNREELSVMEEDLQKITANIEVTNKELALFQQKLEEEVKKDQKEKKANQELLKSLKAEMEELVEEQGSLARRVREKKTNYEAELNDFLELSNQSAAEKMSLEDELKRCEASFAAATRRSQRAQLSLVESSRDQGLYGLYRELANTKAWLTKLDEGAHRHPDLEAFRNTWRGIVQEIEKKISTAEAQYQDQMDRVKSGARVSVLPSVDIADQPGEAAALLGSDKGVPSPPSAPAHTLRKTPPRTQEPPSITVFDKAMEQLTTMFPVYTRSELMAFVQELRSSSGGSLSNMSFLDLVEKVTQLILNHQEKLQSAKSNSVGHGSSSQSDNPPPVASVWQTPRPQKTTTSTTALNVDEPCIICHDDMSPEDICVLNCRHSFHKKCIKSWLKEKTTCPTCREHTLLNEDFPALHGRRRKAL
ncbi:E3 ubiquitin-protein ligase TTC3 isoform X2 [Antennarius striatus]|uniref:E3 ubiquitin-protein ligase TTC3 isoform X2 n=1 Tax=Antennarius striatus TaxID=241820 RepID=UPI0035B338CD